MKIVWWMRILMIILKYVIYKGEGWNGVGLCGKVLVAGRLQGGGFCEKLQEASPMCNRANASQP